MIKKNRAKSKVRRGRAKKRKKISLRSPILLVVVAVILISFAVWFLSSNGWLFGVSKTLGANGAINSVKLIDDDEKIYMNGAGGSPKVAPHKPLIEQNKNNIMRRHPLKKKPSYNDSDRDYLDGLLDVDR